MEDPFVLVKTLTLEAEDTQRRDQWVDALARILD